MPQLNPSPWLMILILTWTFFLFVFLNKTLDSTHPNFPMAKALESGPLLNWNWPWY